jgi:hypothetical protein
VLDANDNPPVFSHTPLRANVTEEIKNQTVIKLVATDADDGPNAEIEYKLESNAKQFLVIDSQTGIVTTQVAFDFEAQRNHTFKVIASDKGRACLGKHAAQKHAAHINLLHLRYDYTLHLSASIRILAYAIE